MKKIYCSILCTVSSILVFAQSSEDLKRLEAFKRQVNTPVVYKSTIQNKVKSQSNILYASNGDTGKKMNIYWIEQKHKQPVIILIHGKTPIKTEPKDWGVYESWGNILAKEGFVCVTFNNSLSEPGKTLKDASNDVAMLIRFVKSHAGKYNIDTTEISLCSFSAGAPLLNYSFINEDKNIKALICFYGFLDLDEIKLYENIDSSTKEKFSLTTYLAQPEKFPPIFIAQAGKENNAGLNKSINKFIEEASVKNIPLTFYNHPTGVHGFDNQNNDSRTKEIIEAMLTFLHKHLNAY